MLNYQRVHYFNEMSGESCSSGREAWQLAQTELSLGVQENNTKARQKEPP